MAGSNTKVLVQLKTKNGTEAVKTILKAFAKCGLAIFVDGKSIDISKDVEVLFEA